MAAQEDPPVVWHVWPHSPDQFRVHWICNINTPKYKDNTKRVFIGAILQIIMHNYINIY